MSRINKEADRLYELLSAGGREVYIGRDGNWYVTYGGGRFSLSAVRDLYDRGLIRSVYSNCPHSAYHVGKTMDVDRTVEARRRGNKHAVFYLPPDRQDANPVHEVE